MASLFRHPQLHTAFEFLLHGLALRIGARFHGWCRGFEYAVDEMTGHGRTEAEGETILDNAHESLGAGERLERRRRQR